MAIARTAAVALMLAIAGGAVGAGDAGVRRQRPTFDREFTLAPGESASIGDTSIGVRFTGVASDSRCPIDVTCIQAGTAVVRIAVLRGGAQRDYELHSGGAPPVRDDDFTIALVDLLPHPHSARAISPGDYRAILRVTRSAQVPVGTSAAPARAYFTSPTV